MKKKKGISGIIATMLGIVLLCQRILYNRYDGVFYIVLEGNSSHSSNYTWKIPWKKSVVGYSPMESQKWTSTETTLHIRIFTEIRTTFLL